MTGRGRRRSRGGGRGLLAAAALLLWAGGEARAQEPDSAAADTTVRIDRPGPGVLPMDTLPVDSLPGDSAAADTAGPGLEEVREGLAGGAFPRRDSIFRELADRQGFRIVEYRGREATLDARDRSIRLRDSAQVNYGDAALRADSIHYRSPLQFMTARGQIRLMSPESREMTTDSVLYYDVSRLKGTVLDARTQFSQMGATWNVRGDAVPVGRNSVYVTRGSFTSCDRDHPHYYFRAGQIKMVSQDVIVAWPVTLHIADVPVFWLPFFAQDIRPDRRSGIVPPEFGVSDVVRTSNDTRRVIRNFGYYWAISRFLDAKATVDWYSGDFTRLNGTFRYRFLKKHLEGSVGLSQEWGQSGKNLRLRFRHDQELSPNTSLRADGQFVQSEQLFRDRSFEDPLEQTQTIDTDIGLRHDMDWASLQVSARRQQFLGTEGRVDLTLPDASVSLSPVTLFAAPRNRAGPFNNMTWSGSANFERREQTRDLGDDRLTTTGRLNQSLNIGRLGLSLGSNVRQEEVGRFRVVPPADTAAGDTAFVTLDPTLQTTADWRASASYQIGLMGSTTLSPTVNVNGGWFRARTPVDTIRGDTIPDTGGDFVQVPTSASYGANLTTDLFGFFPGIGPLSRIRHKISPRVSWSYAPATTLSDTSLARVPGFPAGGGEARNQLTVSLNQTFEGKIPAAGDTAASDSAQGAGARPQEEARKVTLLTIRSGALRFDFERAKQGEPALTTDTWDHSISSDLLRGLSLNLDLDLFEGTGRARSFSPFLSRVNTSFSFGSGTDLGSLVGFGGAGSGGGGFAGGGPVGPSAGARGRAGEGRTGQWNLSLTYSLRRPRPGEAGTETQSLGGNISLHPTPNWQVRWNTSYNITDSEFGYHNVRVTRDLHRWEADFTFTKSPSGNFVFSFVVSLTDAPEIRVPYDQRSGPTTP